MKATFIGPKTYGICVVFISLFSLSLSLLPVSVDDYDVFGLWRPPPPVGEFVF